MSGVRSKLKRIEQVPFLMEWILTISIAFVIMIFFCYIDAVSLTIWSTNLLDCLWEGRPFEYYSYTSQNIHGIFHQSIGGIMLGLIPHAIWNIPIWILQYFFRIEIKDSVLCMMWSRCYYVLVLGLMLWYVYKICKQMEYDKKQSFLILLLSSSSVYTTIALWYGGQNDICWILFAVIAVYSFLNCNWKKFYLFINLALIFKPFFFPAAILLILLREKNVLRIIERVIFSCIGYVVVIFFFRYFPGYTESIQSNDVQLSMFAQYLNNDIEIPYGNASILVMVFIIFCMFCYFIQYSSECELQDWTIYIIMSYNMIWMLTACEHYYRLIMVMPWMYMVLFRRKNRTELSLWLMLLYEGISMLAIRLFDKLYLLTAQRGMSPSIVDPVKVTNAKNFMVSLFYRMGDGYSYLQSIANGAWVGITIVLLVYGCPLVEKKLSNQIVDKNNNHIVQKTLLICHVIIVVPIATMAVISAYL